MMIFMKINEVARALDMSPSTIKKYYLLVEETGYRFKRNQQGRLLFGENDVELFKQLIHMKNLPGVTLQQAVAEVMKGVTDITVSNTEDMTDMTDITDIVIRTSTELSEIKNFMKNQQSQIETLLEVNDKNQRYIEESVSRRDELLMNSIRETQEVKKLLIELKEESKSKKSWFAFFKK